MKKLLLILPLSFIMTCAWSQNSNQVTDKKMSNTLDGRAYKITLSSSGMSDMKGNETMPASGTVNHSTTTDHVATDVTTTDGTVQNQTTINGTSGQSSSTTISTTDEHMKNDKESMSNKTTILRFENGSLQCSFMSKNMSNCPYTITKAEGDDISWNATCKSTTSTSTTTSTPAATSSATTTMTKGNCTWTGSVDRKKISGTMQMVQDNGKTISYSFSGTETDGTKDLGLK